MPTQSAFMQQKSMENKKFLVIGAGSYLGKNYLDYLLKKKLTAYGVSSFYESDNIFKITNLNDNLIDLINSVEPDIIFDFKSFTFATCDEL